MAFIAWTTVSALLLGFAGMTWLTDTQRGWLLSGAALAGVAAAISAGRDAKALHRWSNWKSWRRQQQHDEQVGLHGKTHKKLDELPSHLDAGLAEIRKEIAGKDQKDVLADLMKRADAKATEIEIWFNDWLKNDIDPFPRGQAVISAQAVANWGNAERGGFSEGRVSPEYQTRFHKDVSRLRSEFAALDLFDAELDRVYPHQRGQFDNRAVLVAINGLRSLAAQAKAKLTPLLEVEIIQRPGSHIQHQPGYQVTQWGLTLRNIGVAAEFRAFVKVETPGTRLSDGQRRLLSFVHDGTRKTRIITGSEEQVFFALTWFIPPYNDSVVNKALWFFDPQENRDTYTSLAPTLEAAVGDDFSERDLVLDLEITVLSDPVMAREWKRRYRLGPGNELRDVTP